jgi:hypothetical protein
VLAIEQQYTGVVGRRIKEVQKERRKSKFKNEWLACQKSRKSLKTIKSTF